jgi:hypothetical protein
LKKDRARRASPRVPLSAGRSLLLAVILVGAFPVGSPAQERPSPALHEAYFAWDEGDYVRSMEAYLDVLRGPRAAALTREIALLTGELHPVREVDDDGRNPSISPDGRFLAWERSLDGVWVTRIEPVVDPAGRVQIEGRGVALSGTGKAAWVADGALQLRDLDSGETRSVALEDLRPVALTFAPDRDELFLTSGRAGDGDRLHIFRLEGPDWAPEHLELGEGHAGEPRPATGGRHLVFSRLQGSPLDVPQGQAETPAGEPEVGIMDLDDGSVVRFPGGAPSVAADGSRMAFLQDGGSGVTRVMAVALDGGPGSLAALEPVEVAAWDAPVANPAVSPDGRRVAYQVREHLDWEIYAAATDGSGEELRVTREIQHDLFPAWVSDELLLAMKGEFRHRRAHLYDMSTVDPAHAAEGYELFHNNTLRTIAPQYAWVPDPLGRGILINAERDGNTISPEQGMYWVDLTREVSHDEVVERVLANLAAERELLERGRARFALRADEIRPVADAVSVGRIYHFAEALYAFGSKFATQPGNLPAIEYLAETLASWGYEPELQWFEAGGRGGGARTANVVATLRGTENPEQVYVISSHFDSVLRSPGGDDNSSGTTALLEAARVLADSPRRATIQFAFLTAEEAGLLGAREFVRRAQADGVHIAGVLNNDMIGWTRSHRLDNTIRYSNDGIRDLQHAAAHLFSDLITYDARYYRGTDAAVFFDAYGDVVGGIGSYPVLGNPNYHQPTDELWTINQRLVAEVSRTTVATIMYLADGPSRVTGLEVAEDVANGMAFRWDPAPEAGVVEYRVRVQGGNGEWTELEPVREPRVLVPADAVDGGHVRQVAVRARFADGMESFDDARLRPGDLR